MGKWWRMQRKNINRGYQGLFVWQDAKELYKLTCEMVKVFPFDYKKVVANQIGSVDSIQRNIAEGYCRRGIAEYLQFLNFALGSLGESVSSMRVYKDANQIKETDFETWDQLALKLENGLIKLIKSLQEKKKTGDWEDSFVDK
jgi:four helix bundle protein